MKRIAVIGTMIFACLFASVLEITVLPCFAFDPPEIDTAKIASYRTKIQSRQGDLISIGKSTRSLDDQGMLIEIINRAGEIATELGHLEELAQIKSLMRDEADKQLISKYIGDDIEFAVKRLSLAIKSVNLNMANLRSPAGLTEASKLKDDLHGLEELLNNQ
jgi:hypothetical protein